MGGGESAARASEVCVCGGRYVGRRSMDACYGVCAGLPLAHRRTAGADQRFSKHHDCTWRMAVEINLQQSGHHPVRLRQFHILLFGFSDPQAAQTDDIRFLLASGLLSRLSKIA